MSEEDQYPSQAELNEEDAKDLYRIIEWVRINRPETRLAGEDPADWILRILKASPQAITTVEQLRAIKPTPKFLAGPLIKALGVPAFGDVYELCDDGTWNLLNADEGDSRIPAEQIPLPAVLLWNPARQD